MCVSGGWVLKIAELRKLRAEESAFSTIPFENGRRCSSRNTGSLQYRCLFKFTLVDNAARRDLSPNGSRKKYRMRKERSQRRKLWELLSYFSARWATRKSIMRGMAAKPPFIHLKALKRFRQSAMWSGGNCCDERRSRFWGLLNMEASCRT